MLTSACNAKPLPLERVPATHRQYRSYIRRRPTTQTNPILLAMLDADKALAGAKFNAKIIDFLPHQCPCGCI